MLAQRDENVSEGQLMIVLKCIVYFASNNNDGDMKQGFDPDSWHAAPHILFWPLSHLFSSCDF